MRVQGITINTDASFCSQTGAGGFAFHIVSDYFKYRVHGKIKSICSDSMDAELKCIANALHYLELNLGDYQFEYLYINTDCTPAMDVIRKQKQGLGLVINGLIEKIKFTYKISRVELRHVKAHSNINDSRSVVNRWCDRKAKESMRKKRVEINKMIGKKF